MSQQASQVQQLMICVRNDKYPTFFEVRKVYEVISDTTVGEHHVIRIIDESGDDY